MTHRVGHFRDTGIEIKHPRQPECLKSGCGGIDTSRYGQGRVNYSCRDDRRFTSVCWQSVLSFESAVASKTNSLVQCRLSLAGIFAAVSNLFLGLANALQALASPNPSYPSTIQFAAIGLSEAAILPFAAFACLTVAWLSVAIGMRKGGGDS